MWLSTFMNSGLAFVYPAVEGGHVSSTISIERDQIHLYNSRDNFKSDMKIIISIKYEVLILFLKE